MVKYFAVVFLFVFCPIKLLANEALDPELIIELKKGHKPTCMKSIVNQLRSINVQTDLEQISSYCDCLGVLYFNEFTKSDWKELNESYQLPLKIRNQRKVYQNYCAENFL